jgi:hypothetical protein
MKIDIVVGGEKTEKIYVIFVEWIGIDEGERTFYDYLLMNISHFMNY